MDDLTFLLRRRGVYDVQVADGEVVGQVVAVQGGWCAWAEGWPATSRETGLPHVFGSRAEAAGALVGCRPPSSPFGLPRQRRPLRLVQS